jgi:CRP-like cAMP-binding protein
MKDNLLVRRALRKAFPGIPDNEVDKLQETGWVTRYPWNTVLCKEGEVEDTFYVILDGQVKVTKAFRRWVSSMMLLARQQ